jgi:arginase family enzyme
MIASEALVVTPGPPCLLGLPYDASSSFLRGAAGAPPLIRTLNDHQRAQAKRFGVEVIDMRAWAAGARPRVSGAVYLSVDLDALDPAYAPGVSHREPGGFSVRELLTLIQGAEGVLVGADVVEYNPQQDIGGVTAAVAAKVVREIAGRMMEDAA